VGGGGQKQPERGRGGTDQLKVAELSRKNAPSKVKNQTSEGPSKRGKKAGKRLQVTGWWKEDPDILVDNNLETLLGENKPLRVFTGLGIETDVSIRYTTHKGLETARRELHCDKGFPLKRSVHPWLGGRKKTDPWNYDTTPWNWEKRE